MLLTDIALLTISLIAIVLIDGPRLVRQGFWRELWVFGIILAIGYTLALLRVLGVIIP